MLIDRLRLNHFRNHQASELTTKGARFICLLGDNGAGKTNILEALSLLSPGRGLRRASYDEIGHLSAPDDWSLIADLTLAGGDCVSIVTGRHGSSGERNRLVRFDGEAAKTTDQLLDYVRVLWLTPAMDGLFIGPAGDRRRFLDRLVLAIDPLHGRRVKLFEATMRRRNKLLEAPHWNDSWLNAIEQEFVPLAIAVADARQTLIDQLNAEISGLAHSALAKTFPTAHLALTGPFEAVGSTAATALDLEEDYAALLLAHRARDQAAGRTLIGPHRSDLAVTYSAKDMPASKCSTGEQKALLLGLVLAHARLVLRVCGIAPILLLDEVAAHLDAHRRAALFAVLDELGGQVWMTGTDDRSFEPVLVKSARFAIVSGRIKEI